MIWKSIVMLFSLKDVKRRFNRSHVTKVNAQTFARGYKNVFSWEKLYTDFLILLQKIFYIILRTMILTALVDSAAGIEIFTVQKQPPEVLLNSNQNFTKFTGKHLCQCLFFHKVAGLRPATLLKSRLRHSSCELC